MERFADLGNVDCSVSVELFGCGYLSCGGVEFRSAAFSAPGARSFQASHGSLCDEIALKLGKRAEDVDVLPGLKAGASTPPDGSAVAPQGPPPFLPALKDGVSRRISMSSRADRDTRASGVLGHQVKRPCDHRFIRSQKP